MANTTNFGWETPDDTDLVKDGAAAMRTLGNSIDASFVDLKGGTTGQVLSKNSNTDLDFVWVAQDDSNAIQNTIVDAKADLITATAADTPARLAVGSNNQILYADSSTSTGLVWAGGSKSTLTTTGDLLYASAANTLARLGIGSSSQVLTVSGGVPTWATPVSGGMTSIASGSLSGSSVVLSSISASYLSLRLVLRDVIPSVTTQIMMRFNGDTANNYMNSDTSLAGTAKTFNESLMSIGNDVFTTSDSLFVVEIPDYANTATFKLVKSLAFSQNAVTPNYNLISNRSAYKSASAISSITLFPNSGTFSGGTYELYGVK